MNGPATAAILLAAMTAAVPVLEAHPQTMPSASAGCPAPAQRVEEERFVPIGGIPQWITIRGDRCGNPIVLVLHGGPGNTLSPFADRLFGSWEKQFTVVQWDQRGAGRTYGRTPPVPGATLTLARMTADGVEVVEYLRQRLGQPKVILMGGSWGSVLGVHMVKSRPDLFRAYVGFAQLVSYRENQPASYAKVRAAARAAGHEASIAALEALGAPPWKDPRSFGILRRATRVLEAPVTDPAPGTWWIRAPAYDTPADLQDYLDGEDYSYLQFVGLEGNGMLSRVDLPALGREFDVPVYIAQGAEDLVTVPEVARRYFDAITAPEKEFVMVPRAGHDPNEAMLATLYRILQKAP